MEHPFDKLERQPGPLAKIHNWKPIRALFTQDRPEHDGKLDEDYQVCQANGAWGVEGMILEYKGTTQAIIRPAAALSLLAWLRQEESALESLVKE